MMTMVAKMIGTPPSARVDAKAASMTLKEYAPMALRRHRASVFKGGGTNEAQRRGRTNDMLTTEAVFVCPRLLNILRRVLKFQFEMI